MRKFAFVALVVGCMACGIGSAKAAAMRQGGGGTTVTVTNNGSPASGVTVVLDISNMGKTAHSTVTTESNGSSVLDLSNIGKARVDVYVEVCQNGQRVLIVNSGAVPPDDGTCHDRKKVGTFWLHGGDTLTVDTGTGTATVTPGPSTSSTGSQYETYKPWEVYGGFDYLRFRADGYDYNFAGFDTTLLYNVNSHLGIGFGYGYKRLFGEDYSETRQTFAGVVQESCRHEKYTPFAQMQIGDARFSEPGYAAENGFYLKAGGGVKINLNSTFALIPAQAFWDYNHVEGYSFNNFDLGAGISISLGAPK
ncbi:MAG: hypothetical protein WA405_05410 [Candidatus Acidiferrales bacterium]